MRAPLDLLAVSVLLVRFMEVKVSALKSATTDTYQLLKIIARQHCCQELEAKLFQSTKHIC